MRRRTLLMASAALLIAGSASAVSSSVYRFKAIDGGEIDLLSFRGPVLVVNTASRCGFVAQLDGLQALWTAYRDRGLTVVGVPSNSFRQELASEAAVREFCEVNFSLDFPMTQLESVRGADAHPFYAWARAQDVGPSWNFYKILLDAEGRIAQSFGTTVAPDDPALLAAVEALLPKS
jgi:glutathione peroxidase